MLKMLVGLKHIYVFLLHVFNEAFQLKAFLEDIMRFVFPWLVEIGSRACLPEERHAMQKQRQTMVFISFPNFMSTNSLTISRAKMTF